MFTQSPGSRHLEREFSRHIRALLDGETRHELVFQPIVDLRQGVVTGYEALSRFPNEMGRFTEEVLQRAKLAGKRFELEYLLCARALAARARLPQSCFLSVNVSPQYLLSEWWQRSLGLVDDLAGAGMGTR